ncbi:biotin transporter BioY [Metasolibacillus meyeri]|uniref:biotin transporter BioY n=1 Tax=Metasolibacillus meyeri TaxID=1071052 RepID=UPI000D31093B|nr:biotin transporter BioY [Metasolibacillus meyeri]
MEAVSKSTTWRTVDLLYCSAFATLMMVGANITSFVPFLVAGGVPITLQTFFGVLAGLVLGRVKGAVACTVYMCIGLAGAPVFAKFTGGPAALVSPTFGFLVSFIICAYIAGAIVERYQTKKAYVASGLIAMIFIYLLGTNWLYFAYQLWAAAPEGFSYKMAWAWMVPPMPKDFILAIVAGLLAYRLQKVLHILPIK